MTDQLEFTIWVAWNEDGDYVTSSEREQVCEDLDHEYGGSVRHVACVTLQVTKPEIIQAKAHIPKQHIDVQLSA